MDTIKKSTWEKPELTVIIRSKPEEAVLWYCKNAVGSGPLDLYTGCYNVTTCYIGCHGEAGT